MVAQGQVHAFGSIGVFDKIKTISQGFYSIGYTNDVLVIKPQTEGGLITHTHDQANIAISFQYFPQALLNL